MHGSEDGQVHPQADVSALFSREGADILPPGYMQTRLPADNEPQRCQLLPTRALPIVALRNSSAPGSQQMLSQFYTSDSM
jgi:hypothetical protein